MTFVVLPWRSEERKGRERAQNAITPPPIFIEKRLDGLFKHRANHSDLAASLPPHHSLWVWKEQVLDSLPKRFPLLSRTIRQ